MNYTDNLGLQKPEPEEKYDVETSNTNMDTLDSIIHTLQDAVGDIDNETITKEAIDILFAD